MHDWKSLVACMAEDRRDAGLRRSLDWLLRHGCFPLLPDVAQRLLRNIRDRRRTNDVKSVTWLTPRLQQVLRRRREEFAVTGTKRTRYAGQRNQASLLVSAYSAGARELEEGLAADVGIELRRPFFSHPMVQFAFAAPARYRLRGTTDKNLHRKALTGLLPEPVRTRRTKADFMVTFRWHRAEIDEAFARHRDHASADWVDGDQLARLHARFGDPRCAGAPEWMLWTLFGCEALASSPGNAS
jgi:asparagine synthase (glutamine-hydrolysing)